MHQQPSSFADKALLGGLEVPNQYMMNGNNPSRPGKKWHQYGGGGENNKKLERSLEH